MNVQAFVLVVTLTSLTCFGQQSGAGKPTAKTSPAQHRTASVPFVCPKAKKSCDSYVELLKANDPEIANRGYVCFRSEGDEFFVATVNPPAFTPQYDSTTKTTRISPDARSTSFGSLISFKNGVSSGNVMPHMYFMGEWRPLLNKAMFFSNWIDGENETPEKHSTITIDESQFVIDGYKYKNQLDADVKYYLTIQRSTGRFNEAYVKEGESAPMLENHGRCVWRPVL